MKAIARRGFTMMYVEDAVPAGQIDGPCVIINEKTKERNETTIQVALKWGYWEPMEGTIFLQQKLIIRGKV